MPKPAARARPCVSRTGRRATTAMAATEGTDVVAGAAAGAMCAGSMAGGGSATRGTGSSVAAGGGAAVAATAGGCSVTAPVAAPGDVTHARNDATMRGRLPISNRRHNNPRARAREVTPGASALRRRLDLLEALRAIDLSARAQELDGPAAAAGGDAAGDVLDLDLRRRALEVGREVSGHLAARDVGACGRDGRRRLPGGGTGVARRAGVVHGDGARRAVAAVARRDDARAADGAVLSDDLQRRP